MTKPLAPHIKDTNRITRRLRSESDAVLILHHELTKILKERDKAHEKLMAEYQRAVTCYTREIKRLNKRIKKLKEGQKDHVV